MGDDKNAGRQADIASPQTIDFISNVCRDRSQPECSSLKVFLLSGAEEN